MSSQEYKFALRKMEFPVCAKEALSKIENLIFNTSRSKQDLMMQLISEFIFYEPNMIPVQEFQLVIILSKYLSKNSLPEPTRNAVFMSLFGGSITASRISVLIKLTSTAISAQLPLVLSAVGTLIQQLGCSSPTSLELAKSLVQDFVTYSCKSSQPLQELPKIAPRFAANFMTAVASLYYNEGALQLEPPDLLLEIFTEWVSSNPKLCLASQQPLALPSAMLMMPVVTPLAGLIRWCCLAALASSKNECYSKLHLAVLQSILQATSQNEPPVALNAQHLLLIVNIIQGRIDEMRKTITGKLEDNEAVQICLERLAQAIQCGMSAHCMYGNMPQLLIRLENLKPTNPLMQIVVKMNKQT